MKRFSHVLVPVFIAILSVLTGCATRQYQLPRIAQQERVIGFLQGRLAAYMLEAKKQNRLDVQEDIDRLRLRLAAVQRGAETYEIYDLDVGILTFAATKIDIKLDLRPVFPSEATPSLIDLVHREEAEYQEFYARFQAAAEPAVAALAKNWPAPDYTSSTPERSEVLHARAVLAASKGEVCYGFSFPVGPIDFICFDSMWKCSESHEQSRLVRTDCFTSAEAEGGNVKFSPHDPKRRGSANPLPSR